jgi:CheY-like chemotaxis protein
VLRRLPVELVEQLEVLPFRYDAASRRLCVAVSGPLEPAALARVQHGMRASDLKVFIAAEVVLRNMIAERYYGHSRDVSMDQIIELPALFADEARPAPRDEKDLSAPKPAAERVLLISRTAFLKNFLVSIFERENSSLDVLTDPQEIAASMRRGGFDHILVSKDMEDEFVKWVHAGTVPAPRTELSVFTGIRDALLENPAPYRSMYGSLIHSLQLLADLRSAASDWRPPFGPICEDLRAMAAALGFRRLTTDGLQIAVHLLVPDPGAAAPAGTRGPSAPPAPLAFVDFERSLEIARSLRYPWDIEACLTAFAKLVVEAASRQVAGEVQASIAAQVLALVWYRHSAARGAGVTAATIKSGLRRQAGRLAAPEVVETYLRVLDRGDERPSDVEPSTVLIAGARVEVAQQLSAHLKYNGYRVVDVEDLEEAARTVEQLHPDAVLVSQDSFGDRAMQFGRHLKQSSTALAYAFSARSDANLMMDLLDAGFADVFGPPFNYSIVVARIGKALEARRQQEADASRSQGFHGTLQELPFVDLIQAMAGSRRTLHITLQRGNGEKANIYLRHGQMVHATCGTLAGAEAIFRIIGWREDGTFGTEPVTTWPPDNVTMSNETLLFEGCRLLDEARR